MIPLTLHNFYNSHKQQKEALRLDFERRVYSFGSKLVASVKPLTFFVYITKY